MSRRPCLVPSTMLIAVLCLAASLVNADPVDPRIEKLLAEGKTLLTGDVSAYLDMELDVLIDGEVRQRLGQEIWVGGEDRIRVKSALGFDVCITPEAAVLLETNANVCVWMSAETLEALGEDGPAALAELTFGIDMRRLWDMRDAAACMKIVGEDTVGDTECWVIDLSGALFEAWSGVRKQVGDDFTVDGIQLYVDKEEPMTHRVTIDMSGPVEFSLVMTVLTMDVGLDIAEEQFEHDVPDDALVVKWDAEKETSENMDAFRAAVQAAKQAQQPQQ